MRTEGPVEPKVTWQEIVLDMRFGSQLSCLMPIYLGWEFLSLFEPPMAVRGRLEGLGCVSPHLSRLFVVLRLHSPVCVCQASGTQQHCGLQHRLGECFLIWLV